MAEIFLSATIQVLVEKLLSPDLINYFERREGVHAVVDKWRKMMITIKEVLDDAEVKQITKEGVKMWLQELRDLAFDVEDVLDEFATEALRRKLNMESQASTSKVRSLIPSSFKPSSVMFNVRMGSKIKEITTRLQEIVTQKKSELELRGDAGGTSDSARGRPVNQTSSLEEPCVFGREKDKEEILELVLRGEARDDKVCVIPIIGMGGVGKTTLARDVYNDGRVKGYFHLKAWVCVSEEFDLVRVTKAILESFTKQTPNKNDLDPLQDGLKKELSEKKFLLVLDDVWHEIYEDWTILCRPLETGAPGSKIIVTTRNQGVSSMMRTIEAYCLKALSDDDCLSIFAHHAMVTGGFDAHPELKQTGEEIVKRCKGLPLAAKALGGLLRTKVNLDEWKDLLNSQIWDLPESGIIPALRLSYHHLPPHLKQCFAYCSIFPKDYEFEEEELVLLWMATGLVQQRDESKQMEDIGGGYFRDLLSRSFFQQSSISESRFVMHDLINDLAQWVAGDTCFKLEGKKQCKNSKKARHSTYVGSRYDGVKTFEAFYEVKCLRTFLPLMTPKESYLTNNVPLDLLPKLRCLRVLSLNGYWITELPNSIGDMKHLRYLNLSDTKIKSLPETTSTLYNLQILILRDCSRLEKLPRKMRNLINLRHLDITNANYIKEIPPGVGKLVSLQKLSNFIVGKDNGSGIGELKKLNCLRGTHCISRLENVMDDRDAIEANLKDKQDLDVLMMEWSSEFNASRNERVEKEVLDVLEPHKKLKELTIKCYGGTRFPTWMGDPSFSHMVFLRLENCVKCTSLPPLGQLPLLKDLFIRGMSGLNTVDHEFNGKGRSKPFPSLKTLNFEYMQEWKNWFPSGVDKQVAEFPRLRKLSIIKCPKLLGRLPYHTPSLEKLVIHECQQLSVSFSSLPELCILDINGCQEVVLESVSSVLKSMVLSNISKLSCLTEGLVQGLTKVENLKIEDCNELTSLWQKEVGLLQHLTSVCDHLTITHCPKLISLVEEEVEKQQHQSGLPCRLESLELDSCRNPEKRQGLNRLTSLRKLTIQECPKLVGFPETGLPPMLIELRIGWCNALNSLPWAMTHSSNYVSLEYLQIEWCNSLTSLSTRGELPTTLKRLRIEHCGKLESLAETLHNNTSLERIEIWNSKSLKSLPKGLHNLSHLSSFFIYGCPSLVSFPDGGFPTNNLRTLWIWYCEKLEALPDCMHNLTSLQTLRIDGCPAIVSFPNGGFPTTNLGELWIKDCEKLEGLPDRMHNLTSLQTLRIDGCPAIVSFPNGGFPTTNLGELWIKDCEKLEALPDCMHDLTSLRKLTISNCPGIVSFPEEGFPTNLASLSIKNLKIIKPLFEWGLHRLTSLRWLDIDDPCPDLVSFPEEEKRMMLPTSLTGLTIHGFQNLKYLSSKGFQNLTSLEYLSIYNCPKLKSLPEDFKTSPHSLLQLHIRNCPLLQQRCKKEQGRDWPKIAHIPCVKINDRFIYDPEEKKK